MPDEIKAEVEKLNKGVEVGETVKDGKVGIIVDNEFIEKPSPSASADEVKDYESKREKCALLTPINNLSPVKIKKDGDKYYMIDGDQKEEISKDEAIKYYAENARNAEQKGLILSKKQAISEAMGKCLKDKKINMAEFKKLSKSERTVILGLANGTINSDEFFKGVDLAGTSTIDNVKALKKAITPELLKDYEDEIKNLDDIMNNDKWEDVADDDNDLNKADDEVEDDEGGEEDTTGDDEGGEEDTTGDDEGGSDENTSKKLKNPAKFWKRRKKKNGEGQTKSYYNKDGESISPEEYKDKVAHFKKALERKKKKEEKTTQTTSESYSQHSQYTNLKNYILEKLNN